MQVIVVECVILSTQSCRLIVRRLSERRLIRSFQNTSFGLFVAVFILSVLSLKQGLYDYQITQFVWTIAVLLLVVLQMKTLVFNIYNGLFWFVFPFLSVVVNDVSAYFAGITLGRKLFKNATFLSLSPNKTWEGFLGALVLTLVWAYYSAPTLGRGP